MNNVITFVKTVPHDVFKFSVSDDVFFFIKPEENIESEHPVDNSHDVVELEALTWYYRVEGHRYFGHVEHDLTSGVIEVNIYRGGPRRHFDTQDEALMFLCTALVKTLQAQQAVFNTL